SWIVLSGYRSSCLWFCSHYASLADPLPFPTRRSSDLMHEVVPRASVSGSVTFAGQELYAPEVDPVEVRRRIGMVFQRANPFPTIDRKSTRLNSSHVSISYAVFCLKKKTPRERINASTA